MSISPDRGSFACSDCWSQIPGTYISYVGQSEIFVDVFAPLAACALSALKMSEKISTTLMLLSRGGVSKEEVHAHLGQIIDSDFIVISMIYHFYDL